MRIVYFHGWGGRFNEAKHKILAKFGDEVYYPDIDYQNQRGIINSFANDIYGSLNNGIPNLVIGTSLGGYVAHHVADICRCPALMINPAFFFKNGGEVRPNSNSMSNRMIEKNFVFSAKDEVLDIKRTLKMLKEYEYDDKQIKIYDDLTHEIPLDVFENEFTEFRMKCKDWKCEVSEKEKYILKSDMKKKKQVYDERGEVDDRVGRPVDEYPDEDQVLNASEELPQYDSHADNDEWWDPPRATRGTATVRL